MKMRVQVLLEIEQNRLLEQLATARKVSKSRFIRESIYRYIEDLIPPEEDPALGIIGLAGKLGLSDLAERHDKYLAQVGEKREQG